MMEVKKTSDTVCIVGLAPTTRDQALDEPAGEEMWCLNQGHATLSAEMLNRMTRWFQVHPYEEMAARQRPEFGHLEWLRDNKTLPVYMEEAHPDVPMSVRYPYEAVCSDLGGVYLTSAIAFMVALAIHEKFSVIKVYGVDMESGTEYQDQRPCMEYLFGRAIERGIKIWLPAECPLLKGPMYAKTVMVATSYIQKRMQELITAAGYRRDEYREMAGQVKLCRGLALDKRLTSVGTILDEITKELTIREKNLLAEYNNVVGSVRMCEELLFVALKGSGTPETAELVQAVNGMVSFRHGEDRLYSKMADDGAAPADTRFWPGNLPPVDISEQAEAVISLHNRRIKPA